MFVSFGHQLHNFVNSMIVDSATALSAIENLYAILTVLTFLWIDMRNLDRQIP